MSIMRTMFLVVLITAIALLSSCSTDDSSESQAEPDSQKEDERLVGKTEDTQEIDALSSAVDESIGGTIKRDEIRPPVKDEPAAPTPKPPPATARGDEPSKTSGPHPGLMNPAAAKKAPDQFKVRFTTTRGDFVIEVDRSWAPFGADRFYNLVTVGFFQEIAFFRVIEGFMVQFGIHGDPTVSAVWRNARIQDDTVVQSNSRGTISFATAGPNTRTTQLFINFGNNTPLDRQGFSPFGRVIEGMDIVDSLYKGYGEGAPRGAGPDQNLIQQRGNQYLKSNFPKLDFVKSATLVN